MRLSYVSLFLLFYVGVLPQFVAARVGGVSANGSNPELNFLENKGQIVDQHGNSRQDIDFSLCAHDVNVFVGKGQLHYQWSKPVNASGNGIKDAARLKSYLSTKSQQLETYRLDVRLLQANINAPLVKEEQQVYYEYYYLPQCGDNGVRANAYRKMTYKNVYPHIDWVVYINEEDVEYDFVVHPGGKVADIQLQYEGADQLNINEDGSLGITTPMGYVTESAPYSFQEDGSVIASHFIRDRDIIRFGTGKHTGKLTIDPKLKWATYYGGGSGFTITGFVDGYMDREWYYACGMSNSINNIATTGSHQTTLLGSQDAYLVKFNNEGKRIWATYFGGTKADDGYSVVADTLGNIYLSGPTESLAGIATSGAHQVVNNGGSGGGLSYAADLFLIKFDSSGLRKWGTYYGGAGNEYGGSLAYSSGYIYMAGVTRSNQYIATSGTYHPNYMGAGDNFLVKFDLDGVRQWGTYFGGKGSEGHEPVIASDKMGNIYLAGETDSDDDIATSGSFKVVKDGASDHYLAKFNDKGNLLWSTYYGGEGEELLCNSISCDDKGTVYLTGITNSSAGIASLGASQSKYGGQNDGYLVKFNNDGRRQWGTYIGGSKVETYIYVHADKSGNVFLTGATASDTGIATNNAIQPNYMGAGLLGSGDAFILQYDSSGAKVYGTYFGGTGDDMPKSLEMDQQGYLYICGSTSSSSAISTPGSHLEVFPSAFLAGLVTKFCFTTVPIIEAISGKDTVCLNALEAYVIDKAPDADAYIWSIPAGWSGGSDSNRIELINNGTDGTISVKLVRCGDTSLPQTLAIYVVLSEKPVISVDGFVLSTAGSYKGYQWLLNGNLIPGATGSTYPVTENGEYAVITENAYGCMDTSLVYKISNVGLDQIARLAGKIQIFPNPATQILNVQSPVPVQLRIMGIDGHVSMRTDNSSSIDISVLSPAMYILQVYNQEGTLLKAMKFIKSSEE